jgi:hypothetical protein
MLGGNWINGIVGGIGTGGNMIMKIGHLTTWVQHISVQDGVALVCIFLSIMGIYFCLKHMQD